MYKILSTIIRKERGEVIIWNEKLIKYLLQIGAYQQ